MIKSSKNGNEKKTSSVKDITGSKNIKNTINKTQLLSNKDLISDTQSNYEEKEKANFNSKTKYNPWENQSNFVQDVGDLSKFVDFLKKNNLDSENQENQKSIISSDSLDVLKNFENISKQHFEALSELENLYEKFRNEPLLSNEKNWEILDKINYLNECFKLIENNKIKLANILHNTNLSDSSAIKIKQAKKLDFLKLLKIILCRAQDDSNLEMINLSFNLHKENIKKLTNKYEEINKVVENFIKEYEQLVYLIDQ
jgi:hypothetical protein